jgi:hypothetical protein
VEAVFDLPMTDGWWSIACAEALEQWRRLSKGVLPDLLRTVPFPADPFRTKFAVRREPPPCAFCCSAGALLPFLPYDVVEICIWSSHA